MKIRLFKRERNIKDITKEEMFQIITKIKNVILLDVRSIQEYNEGHFQGAINIPFYELEKDAEKIIKDKNAIIIAYCSAGIRSKKAMKTLNKMGYNNLYNVNEGIDAWQIKLHYIQYECIKR